MLTNPLENMALPAVEFVFSIVIFPMISLFDFGTVMKFVIELPLIVLFCPFIVMVIGPFFPLSSMGVVML